MTPYQEPPGGDYSRYVEELNKKAVGAGKPMTVGTDRVVESAWPRPAKAPPPAQSRSARAASQAKVAVAPRQQGAASQSAMSAAPPSVAESLAHLRRPWQIIKAPVFAWLGFEILSIWFPRLGGFSFIVLLAAVAWAVQRFSIVAGGWSMDAWSRLGRQWVEELEQQQHRRRR